MTLLNIEDIERYFKFLSLAPNPDDEVFTYCFLDAEAKDVIKGHGVKFGTREHLIKDCELSVNLGFTLHTTLNRTRLNGRRVKDIDSPRVLCVDFDRIVEREELKQIVQDYKASLVVETSPGKYHVYWKLSHDIKLSEWKQFQLGLAFKFNADLNLAQVNHTIRVPGVSRVCKDGSSFTPNIIWDVAVYESLTYRDVLQLFPWIQEVAASAERVLAERRRERSRAIKDLRLNGANKSRSVAKLAQQGDRNSSLYALLYGYVTSPKGEGITHDGLLSIAEEFNTELQHHPKGQLEASEIDKTVRSAFERGMETREKRAAKLRVLEESRKKMHTENIVIDMPGIVIPARDDNSGTNGHHGFSYDASHGALQINRFTEAALVERVLQKFGSRLVRVGKGLYAFDSAGKMWRPQRGEDSLLYGFAKSCAKDTVLEAEFLDLIRIKEDGGMERKQKAEEKWLSQKTLANTMSGVVREASIPRMTLHQFDTNPFLFLCANGVLDLRSRELREAVAGDYLLRRSDVVYDPTAKCPYFENFVDEVFAKNEAPSTCIGFIQELFGYSLTGDTGEQTVWVHVGEGANGKSRVLNALASLTGDYSSRMLAGVLAKAKNAVGKELERVGAKIEGKRCVIVDDLDTKTQWNEGLVKGLTERTMIARNLYEEERDVPNTAKIHIGCNDVPAVEQANHAIFRRVCILEYKRQFKVDSTKVCEIDNAVKAELSGILNWALDGLTRVLAQGSIKRPPEVEARIEVYRESNSSAEDLIPRYLAKPESGEDKHALREILKHLEMQLGREGQTLVMGLDRLGMMMRRYGYANTRERVDGVKTTFYHVKLNEGESHSL